MNRQFNKQTETGSSVDKTSGQTQTEKERQKWMDGQIVQLTERRTHTDLAD